MRVMLLAAVGRRIVSGRDCVRKVPLRESMDVGEVWESRVVPEVEEERMLEWMLSCGLLMALRLLSNGPCVSLLSTMATRSWY